jgi:chromosome segregation protein
MKIKRLEISGFKSFVEKATFDFPAGVTAVVGPNGCGKSNVVDAIRWVMGEQSAKNLRGRMMEDIIFGGCESRKPLGMAEVSLIFSTDDGRIPAKYLNFSEIQVTRRLYRDGESEYLLNKTPCRLMDITELFMDTGVGARAYSIIEQGRIGMILMAKPEERRFLIEEAAGVTKYKSRRQLALKKIESTRQNLLRISDIVSEIQRQLNALHRQAKKAERFRTVREELKKLELYFAAKRHAELSKICGLLETELEGLHASEATFNLQLEQRAAGAEERRILLLEEEKRLGLVQEELLLRKSELQGGENRLEFQKKEILSLERQLIRIREEVALLEKQREETALEKTSLEAKTSEFMQDSFGEGQSLEARELELETATSAEQAAAALLEESRRKLFGLLNELNQVSNQHQTTTKRLEGLSERFERSRTDELLLRERLSEAKERTAQLEQRLTQERAERENRATSLAQLLKTEEELKTALSRNEQLFQKCRDNHTRIASRLHSLRELEAQFAGYGQGVRTLMLEERFKKRFSGLVADVIETDERYEAAVEAVLGERLQAVIAGNRDDIVAAVEHLKSGSGGRCSFVMPSGAAPLTPAAPAGAKPILAEIQLAESCRSLLQPLFEKVMLVDDLATAIDLSHSRPELTFVTLQGDIAYSGGIVDGGSAEPARHGLIHKKRELRELATSEAEEAKRISLLELELKNSRTAVTELQENIRQLRSAQHQGEMALLALDKDLHRATEEHQRFEERLAVKQVEDEQLLEEKTMLEEETGKLQERRLALDELKTAAESQLADQQESLAEQRKKIEFVREQVTAMKVQAAALHEKREATAKALTRVAALETDLTARLLRQVDELANGEESLCTLRSAEVETGAEIVRLLELHRATEASLAVVREQYEDQSRILREEEAAIRDVRSAADELHRKLTETTLRLSAETMELQHLQETLRNKYRLELAEIATTAESEPADSDETLQQRHAELQKQVDEMGEVNLTAIEEYQELEERYKFLSGQKADLEESLQSLMQAIQRINRTTKKRFAETFELVNDKFKEVFPRLFCGGRAELKLTNEDDLLETGLDIVVQPPGKKLQNVSLLSGGEKALTAVALIFSIFMIKPSPFCLLDEVDAPLDDANIGRFNEMIREMSAFSQFILITHSKTTMAVADTLYGVTMEEPGVSKLVSVKLQ